VLRVRWLGRVAYADALVLQRALHANRDGDDHLLLLEHPHVFTLGVRGSLADVLVAPATVGAEVVRADRGGQVTYHGPGQLVGYPILNVAGGPGAVPAHMAALEQVVIDALADLGLPGCGRVGQAGHEGVWVDPTGPSPRKICAVGARVTRGRSMHGFALNVTPDLSMFGHIVPCGLSDAAVTSLRAEGSSVSMADVVDAVVARAARRWAGDRPVERQDVAWRVAPADLAPFSRGEGPGLRVKPDQHRTPVRLLGRLAEAGVDAEAAVPLAAPKPAWLRPQVHHGPEVLAMKRRLHGLDLVTVCEEAGCPNLSECWAEGTATFMVLGSRCTRACGFCLVDTDRPGPPDPGEPARVAEAVARAGITHAVVTMVARDDLPDGGAAHLAATIAAIRHGAPGAAVEVLLSDLKGDAAALATVAAGRPDVWNHNVETVPRLQRAVRPQASYARSLAVLAAGRAAGLPTKSSIILGMGEEEPEVLGVLADLAAIGTGIVTLGQYLRPTTNHLPVARWWHPDDFRRLKAAGEAMGIAHVEASPLTRSSFHAAAAAAAAAADRTHPADPAEVPA
jgi:lipoic acid synthetase